MTINSTHGIWCAILLGPLVIAGTAASGQATSAIPFPQEYRSWQHVKTIVIGPGHKTFSQRGGIHHYYANAKAVEGYRTGTFPNGSIIADEGVATKDGEGDAAGILLEAARRSLNVMVKDDRLFKDTGGWGFENFQGDDPTGRLGEQQRAQCYQCHAKSNRDHVFTVIRP
jgi:hypothetical protein